MTTSITVEIYGETNHSGLPSIGLMPDEEDRNDWRGIRNTKKNFLMWNKIFSTHKNTKKYFK
jgi:hypothetical protein